MANAKRDNNRITTMLGVTDDLAQEVRNLLIDPATGALLVKDVAAAAITGADNGIYIDNGVIKLGTNPLVDDTTIDIDGNRFGISGEVGASGRNIAQAFGEGVFGIADGYGLLNTYNDGTDDFQMISVMGDATATFGDPFLRIFGIFSDTSDRQIFEQSVFDDGRGNQNPGFGRFIYNDDQSQAQFFNMNSEELGFGWYQDNTTDTIVTNFTTDQNKSRIEYVKELASGEQRRGISQAQETYAETISEYRNAGGDRYRAGIQGFHNNGTYMYTRLILETGSTVLNTLTLTETGFAIQELPAFADDTDAGSAGLSAGTFYQTNGSGASPLNVAGIVMIKQ